MTTQVVNVTPPAAGHDWTFTVPGQWLPYLYGVTATLKSGGALTTLIDETGNGHDATITTPNGFVFPVLGPYAGGIANGAVFHSNDFLFFNGPWARTALSFDFGSALLSVDGWWKANAKDAGNFQWGDFWGLLTGGFSNNFSPCGKSDNTAFFNMAFASGGFADTVDTVFMATGGWHHIAWTWDGTDWRVYLDGAFVFLTAAHPPLGRGSQNRFELAGDNGLGTWSGSTAGVAYYNAALSGAQVAAHAAAGASAAGYKTAALADAPVAYFGLNSLPVGPSRLATLQVTDGTHVVAQFPANFSAIDASGFVWSWQAFGPGAAASTDGTINSVPIPELAVSSGYTIGTVTLDLAPTDQWGDITLWFDDGTGPGGTGPGGAGGVDYLDARFVPDVPNG